MRIGMDNGNGAQCDKCGKLLRSKECIKLKFLKLDSNPDKAATGCYKTIISKDLCIKCYNNILNNFC